MLCGKGLGLQRCAVFLRMLPAERNHVVTRQKYCQRCLALSHGTESVRAQHDATVVAPPTTTCGTCRQHPKGGLTKPPTATATAASPDESCPTPRELEEGRPPGAHATVGPAPIVTPHEGSVRSVQKRGSKPTGIGTAPLWSLWASCSCGWPNKPATLQRGEDVGAA